MMTLTPTTRASLLLRLRDSKDHDAWVEFVTLYEPVVYRLFRRHGLQDADAREVMQELFVIVSRNIDRWESDKQRGSFRGWLRVVVRNLTINWLKHRQRRLVAQGGTEVQAMFQLLPDASGPESVEFDHELRRALFHQAAEHVRNEVNIATWQAFWETSIEGISIADVAKKLGLTAGAVRVAKCRVLARLRTKVAEMENQT
jgi:RNA polymerase sigma factor (sigma-70 family)